MPSCIQKAVMCFQCREFAWQILQMPYPELHIYGMFVKAASCCLRRRICHDLRRLSVLGFRSHLDLHEAHDRGRPHVIDMTAGGLPGAAEAQDGEGAAPPVAHRGRARHAAPCPAHGLHAHRARWLPGPPTQQCMNLCSACSASAPAQPKQVRSCTGTGSESVCRDSAGARTAALRPSCNAAVLASAESMHANSEPVPVNRNQQPLRCEASTVKPHMEVLSCQSCHVGHPYL